MIFITESWSYADQTELIQMDRFSFDSVYVK